VANGIETAPKLMHELRIVGRCDAGGGKHAAAKVDDRLTRGG
jgi:hypothetical protein